MTSVPIKNVVVVVRGGGHLSEGTTVLTDHLSILICTEFSSSRMFLT